MQHTRGQSAGKSKEINMTPQRPNVRSPASSDKLKPEWITGFVDGEGCFHIGISRHPELRFGYQILPELTVVQHMRDIGLLHRLRTIMGCGVVRRNHDDRYCWRVRDLKNLVEVIVPFFERYHLRSMKGVEFRRFAKVVRMMARGEHLKEEGFEKIRRIADLMNRGESRNIRIKRESIPE